MILKLASWLAWSVAEAQESPPEPVDSRSVQAAEATADAAQDAPQGAPSGTPDETSKQPDALADREADLARLARDDEPLPDRVEAAERLLESDRDLPPEQVDAIVRAFAERERRELVALVRRILREETASRPAYLHAAQVAERVADPALVQPLTDRIALTLASMPADPSDVGRLLPALRASQEAARRRIAELEAERLAQAPVEACAAALDSAAIEVRNAALARLLELAQRRDPERKEPLEPVRERVRTRLAALLAAPPTRASPQALDELRMTALLAAELRDDGGELARHLVAAFDAPDAAGTRAELVPALRRAANERPHAEIAGALARAIGADAPPALVEAALDALRLVGSEPALDAIEPWIAREGNAGSARTRERALAAASELARRSAVPAFTRRVLDLLAAALQGGTSEPERLGAALGLSVLVQAIAEKPRESTPQAALDAENLARAFDVLRVTLPTVTGDLALAAQVCKGLVRVPGREADAAGVLASTLVGSAASAPIRVVLLQRLKELAHPGAIPAIVASLPRGGPAVEPDAEGTEAGAALRAVIAGRAAGGDGTAAEIAVIDACLDVGQSEWATYFAGQLLDQVDRPEREPDRVAIRLAYGRAAVASLVEEQHERAWSELLAIVEDERADEESRRRARRLLLELAERRLPERAIEAARHADALLADDGLEPGVRAQVARAAAGLLFLAGEWRRTCEVIAREFAEAELDTPLLLMHAKAAARRTDVEGRDDAIRLLERLVGERGRGGRLGAEAPERPGLVLALASAYCEADREEDARAALAAIPTEAKLSPELVDERRRLEQRLAGT